MKTITLEISDEVYIELCEDAKVRFMMGKAHLITDRVIIKLIQGIEEKDDIVTLAFKDEDCYKDKTKDT